MDASGYVEYHSGFLTKKGALVKNWKRRFFVLAQLPSGERVLQYFRMESTYGSKVKPRGSISMEAGPMGYEPDIPPRVRAALSMMSEDADARDGSSSQGDGSLASFTSISLKSFSTNSKTGADADALQQLHPFTFFLRRRDGLGRVFELRADTEKEMIQWYEIMRTVHHEHIAP